MPLTVTQLVERLHSQSLQLRRSALMDLGAIGYLPRRPTHRHRIGGKQPEADCPAGRARTHLQDTNFPENGLSAESRQVLALMDDLL